MKACKQHVAVRQRLPVHILLSLGLALHCVENSFKNSKQLRGQNMDNQELAQTLFMNICALCVSEGTARSNLARVSTNPD